MADRCVGCTNKYKFREKPTECPKCHKRFCNSCLNPKKVKESGQTCVYCSQRQKTANKKEESEIIQNFHDRYYKHLHQGPPIVSRIQNEIVSAAAKTSPNMSQNRPAVILSPEDRALEERFKKLREDKVPTNPSSEEEIAERLNKLTGSKQPLEGGRDKGLGIDPLGRFRKPESQQADELMDQALDEVKLDQNLDNYHRQQDEELSKRFDDLRGRQHEPKGEGEEKLQPSVDRQVDGTNSQSDIDPETVLHDLECFQLHQEQEVLKDLESSDIKELLEKVKPNQTSEGRELKEASGAGPGNNPGTDCSPGNNPGTEKAILELFNEAERENKKEQAQIERDNRFIEASSKRLQDLYSDEDSSGDEVRSKPKGAGAGAVGGMDFKWHHFGSEESPPGATGGVGGLHWAGVSLDLPDDEDFDHEVQQLIQQMIAEGELDDKLEKSGYTLPKDKPQPVPDKGAPVPDKGASVLPTASRPYTNFGNEDVLLWCCICNNDAVIRCAGCDDDLYCSRCFSEGHQQFGLFDHQYTIIKT